VDDANSQVDLGKILNGYFFADRFEAFVFASLLLDNFYSFFGLVSA